MVSGLQRVHRLASKFGCKIYLVILHSMNWLAFTISFYRKSELVGIFCQISWLTPRVSGHSSYIQGCTLSKWVFPK